MLNLLFTKQYHYVTDEINVTKVLTVLNSHKCVFIKQNLKIDNCGMEDAPDVWYIKFDATSGQIKGIIKELIELFDMKIIDTPDKVHLFKKTEGSN